MEVIQQLLICRGLLQRVQLAPMQVLQQGIPQEVLILGLPNDGRYGAQPRGAGRAQPPLTHDQLKACARPAHDDRLQDTDLPDAGAQLRQFVLIEDRAWLARIRGDGVNVELGEAGHDRVGEAFRLMSQACWPGFRSVGDRR